MTTKILIIEAGEDYNDDDCGPVIKVETINDIVDIVHRFGNEIAQHAMAIDELLKNEQIISALDNLGYRNVERIEDIDKKIIAERGYFIYSSQSYANLRKVDLDNLKRSEIEELANEHSLLLQSVSKSSLKQIAISAYNIMLGIKRKITETNNAKKARKEALSVQKKQR